MFLSAKWENNSTHPQICEIELDNAHEIVLDGGGDQLDMKVTPPFIVTENMLSL